MHQVEEAVPPGQAKKMYSNVHERSHTIANGLRLAVLFRHIEGPKDNQRTPNNVFFRHKAPIAAVQAVIAVVTHGKVVVRWNNHFFTSNTGLESRGPFRRNLANTIAQSCGKFIAICIVRSIANYVWLG